MKRAVIFDMGGVLIDLDIEGCKQYFKTNLGFYDVDKIIDACHQKGIWGEMEEGKITADEFRQIVLASSREGATAEDVDAAVRSILVDIMPEKVTLLKKIAAGYDIYMLSNNNPIAMAEARHIFSAAGVDVDKDFVECFLSHEMKMLKPSADFYKAVMTKIGIPAEQMLFIDDSQRNVDGAVEAGLPAVYYEPGTDLSALLADALADQSLLVKGGEA